MAPSNNVISARGQHRDKAGVRKRMVLILCAWTSLVGPASIAVAQSVHLRVQDGPHYVGEPIVIQVTTAGFDGDPEPVCESGPVPEGLSLSSLGVPSRSAISQTVVQGNRSQTYTRLDLTFNFQVVAAQAGTYKLAPFTVQQNNRRIATKTVHLQVQEIESSGDMRVALVLPGGPLYPGQRIPVKIEWWYAGDVNTVNTQLLYSKLTIRSALFDQFEFIDQTVRKGDSMLPIVTGNEIKALKARATTRTLDGRSFVVVSASRLMRVDKAGEYELAPITASVPKVTRWRQTVFGREPAATTRLRAIGRTQKLVVAPLPLDRPPSFAGALGHGFSIDVKADRSVVQVGDPIELTVTIRGDGNLQTVGLPLLSVRPGSDTLPVEGTSVGLDPKLFRLPDQEVAGVMAADAKSKRFVVTVRVLHESVAQIPRIPYSWFDPSKRAFATVYSDPIALHVRSAQMVGAADVVAAAPEETSTFRKEDKAKLPQSHSDVGPGERRLDLTGADLANQTDTGRLLIDESMRFGGVMVRGTIYVASVLLVVAAWLWRRVAEVDPKLSRRRRLIRQQIRQIALASRLPRQQAADQIARALRHIAAVSDRTVRGQIDRLLAECDVVAFAPAPDDSQQIDAVLHERAIMIARSVAKETA